MRSDPTLVGKMVLVISLCLSLSATATQDTNAQSRKSNLKSKIQTARVFITENGYSRASISLRRGVPTRITFLRQTDATCATDIVIPEYRINKPLPLNMPVVVSFTPKRSGEIGFSCGMNMMRGKLIVR